MFSHPLQSDGIEGASSAGVPPAKKMLAAGYGDGTLRVFDVDKVSWIVKAKTIGLMEP